MNSDQTKTTLGWDETDLGNAWEAFDPTSGYVLGSVQREAVAAFRWRACEAGDEGFAPTAAAARVALALALGRECAA